MNFLNIVKECQRKYLFLQSVRNKIIAEAKRFGQQYRKGKFLILEDVQSLFDYNLNANAKDLTAMHNFEQQYKALSQQQKWQLVKKLQKPQNGKFIQNNNEIKLILIYRLDKNSQIGRQIFEKIVTTKMNWFETLAGKAAANGRIPSNQVQDYAQQMGLMLCGGGHYNENSGGKYSLDGYDPYSGVPINIFIRDYIVNPAMNKFTARYNKSIAGDYIPDAQKQSVSLDAPVDRSDDNDDKQQSVSDKVQDMEADDLFEKIDKKQMMKILNNYLNDKSVSPKQQKQREAIKMKLEGKTPEEIGYALGYKNKGNANVSAGRIIKSGMQKLKAFFKALEN